MKDLEGMPLLYEDKDIAVVAKPAGLLSAGDGQGEMAIPDILAAHSGGKAADIVPVTRLDRNVSGVMLLSKNSRAAAKLSQAVQDHDCFQKEYLAVLCGVPNVPQAVLTDLLFKDSAKNKSFVVDKMRRGVREARLAYRLLATAEGKRGQVSLVRVRLYTGRTHQIRVQFSSRHLPLYGDGKYGGPNDGGKIALHAYSISFPHPNGKPMCFTAPIPQEGIWSLFDIVDLTRPVEGDVQ